VGKTAYSNKPGGLLGWPPKFPSKGKRLKKLKVKIIYERREEDPKLKTVNIGPGGADWVGQGLRQESQRNCE